jgi:hypothetical protein
MTSSPNDDPTDAVLLDALEPRDDELLTLDELADTANISTVVISMLVREGWIVPHPGPGGDRFDRADLGAVSAGLRLVEAGLPMAELLDLARRMDEAMDPVAELAVDVFARFVRDSVEASAASTDEAATTLQRAVDEMMPATAALVGEHFRRLVVKHATARLVEE